MQSSIGPGPSHARLGAAVASTRGHSLLSSICGASRGAAPCWLLRRSGSRLLKGKARGPRILGLCALCQARKVISPVTATLLLYSRLRKWSYCAFTADETFRA